MNYTFTDPKKCSLLLRTRSLLLVPILLLLVVSRIFAFDQSDIADSKRDIQHRTSASFAPLQIETDWTQIYADSSLKVFYTEIECESAPSVRLKVQNLTNSELNFTYKIWTASNFPKTIQLQSSQTLEGICATAYSNLLVEAIPTGSNLNNINVQINYNQ